jgi:hypothetical protein
MYSKKMGPLMVMGPGKSMWWGLYPWCWGGRRQTSSGTASAALLQMVEVISTSVTRGR